MASVFSENLRIQNAENFKYLIDSKNTSRLYFTFGKTLPWSNESVPDTPTTSVTDINNVWDNMIGAKLLLGSEAKIVIPRNNWAANTKYAMYDNTVDSPSMFSNTFFILTSDWNVYKCLNNANTSNSTVMPTQVFTDKAVEEVDGYIWKYMYTVPAADQIRFVTSAYIPVQTLSTDNGSLQWDVQEAAVAGGIESIKVTSGGSGYTDANTVTITITGDGTDAVATARVNTTTNTISSIVMTNIGRGYSTANVSISGPGTGAAARAIISPPGGHGSNPVYELGGKAVMLNPRLAGTESGKFPVGNDLRQLAIIANPLERSDVVASNTIYKQYVTAVLDTSVSNYILDEDVYQGASYTSASFTGKVEFWDSGNNTIHLVNTRGTLQSDALVGVTTGTARYVLSITQSELKPYSGSLLYINNIQTIVRSADQTEDVKLVIQF